MKTPTVIVWDNIDFGEETTNGAGTTHHTNGIMVQSTAIADEEKLFHPTISKKQRSFIPKLSILEHHHQQK